VPELSRNITRSIVYLPSVYLLAFNMAWSASHYDVVEAGISIRCLESDAAEVFIPNQTFESYAISERHQECDFSVREANQEVELQNGSLVIKIDAQGVASFYRREQLLFKLDGLSMESGKPELKLDVGLSQSLMGAGSRVLTQNLRGQQLPLYNRAHYGYGAESKQMYFSMPLLYSDMGYYIVFDNAGSGKIDVAANDNTTVHFSALGGRGAFVVVTGDDWPSRLANLTKVTGRQPMPPRWALGSFASRFGYRTQQQVLDTAKLYDQYSIGLDALVIDLFWFGPDIKGHMGNLRFDLDAFPEPKEMMADLKAKGVNPILITEPFVLKTSSRFNEAKDAGALAKDSTGRVKTFDFYFGHTGLVDVFSDQGRHWFESIYAYLDQFGVVGWWGDLGEPEVHPDDTVHAGGTALDLHNAYGHVWAKLVYEHALKMRPAKRPFVMMRSGFVGSQRYGMIPWSGDVGRNWSGLKAQPEIMLSMGMQGIAYMHSDLGGFTPADQLDEELYIRWLQMGVFTPVFRPHAEESVASEPVYHREKVRKLAKNAIDLRYRLMPYLYTMVYENSETGMPLARPMALEDDQLPFELRDQYMWGPSLLVAPILESAIATRKLRLPTGIWYTLDGATAMKGNQQIEVALTEEAIPVFVKGGSVIPTASGYKNLAQYNLDQLQLNYYLDDISTQLSAYVYHDDGSLNAKDQRINYAVDQQDNKLLLQADAPASWSVYGLDKLSRVTACGVPISYSFEQNVLQITKSQADCVVEVLR